MALKPIWDWFEGLFPGAAAKLKAAWGAIASIGTWVYDNTIKPIWDWFIGLFDFSSFGAGLMSAAKLIFLPFTALLGLVTGVWTWFKGLFGFGEKTTPTADADTSTGVMGFLTGLVTGIWTWFKGLFDFSSVGAAFASVLNVIFLPYNILLGLVKGIWNWFGELFGFDMSDTASAEEETKPGGIGGIILNLVNAAWDYLKKLFKFGSIGDVMKSYFNLLTFFPNIIKDAIAGVTSWLLGLFGFDEAAKTVANAKNFSLGDMLFNTLSNIFKWFTDFFNIDVEGLVKSIPGGAALWKIFGDSAAEKKTEELTKGGLMKSDEGTLDADQIVDVTKLQGMMKGMSVEGIKGMFADMKEINESDMFGKGDEIANWEVVQKTMQEGIKLAALQKEANELSGGGSTTTIIQDNSQNQSNSSQPLVIPTPEISPGNGGASLPTGD